MHLKKKSWFSSLLSFAAYCKGKIIASVIFSVISVTAGLIPYLSVYKILEAFIQNRIDTETIFTWSGIAAGAYLIKTLFFGISTALSHISAYVILEKLRLLVADKFLRAPLGEVTDKPIGEIKNMIVDKIESIEPPLAHVIPEASGNLVLPLVSILILAAIDWRMALASLVTVPLTMIPFSMLMKSSGNNYEKYMKSSNTVSSVIVEYIEGIQVIKTFGQTGRSYEKFSNAIVDYRRFILDWMSSTWVTMKLCVALFPSTLLGALPVGLLLCVKGALTPAELCLCVMIAMSMVGSLAHLEVFMNEIKQMGFIIRDTQSFLDMPELPQPAGPAPLNGFDVRLSGVRFSYTGKEKDEVLHGIDLHLPQGGFTALVGPSGGGKSTVAKLIARFWDVTGGSITIGGTDIRDMPLSQLSSLVSFVTQDNYLFQCSLLENIRIGNPGATDGEVRAAAKAAQCDGFISKLENGYDTPAGEAGSRLSGGEKQRIAIARMILKNAPIVILDEATAFTDPENEDKMQRSISELTRGKTLLVIAHRLSTIKNADNIVVLKDGGILAQGRQEDLLNGCPLYREMWKAHIGAKAWTVSQRKEAGAHV
ncbi:MAG: ABC transporter ATP-binding protein [Ruminococcaceae bacterium]|nr:ABC transporter ATP-binding protein [Oscillospiraceae bacterium]